MMSPEMHEQHMEKVEAGLQQIISSNDINEIKQIAQSLLNEEEAEMKSEKPNSKEMFKKQMEQAVGGGNAQAMLGE